MSFDPNGAADEEAGIFGIPSSLEGARVVLLPVPWDATTSYGGGAAQGPRAVYDASMQVDLFDVETGRPYEAGIFMLPISDEVSRWNETARELSKPIVACGGRTFGEPELESALARVNAFSQKVNQFVYDETQKLLSMGKIAGVLGGDHSVPLGAMRALGERVSDLGILHIDAHADLREAYEGFVYSHASIMFNVLEEIPSVRKIVQVGVRDLCEAEHARIQKDERIHTLFDVSLARGRVEGKLRALFEQAIAALPQNVYVSFDIDGLDPALCPNTGTPVPGGLSFHEASMLVGMLSKSGRTLVGFDLNEVAPGSEGEWDANVGARVLYKLIGWTLKTPG